MTRTSAAEDGMALAQDEDGDRQPAGSALTRSLELLETVAAAAEAPTVAELCHKLSLPKPTVHRLCQRLEGEGYLAREPGGRRFAAGPRLLRMGLDALRSGVGASRRAVLEEVVREIGETCNFTTLVGHEVVYLERVEARWPLRMHLEPGSRVPLHCTASGKLFLAAMTPARRARALDAIDLAAFTPSTITDRAALEVELATIRRQGFSEDREEFLLGLVAISAPVVGRDGATIAAVACHGPSARFDLDDARRHLPTLRTAAGKLAATLLG